MIFREERKDVAEKGWKNGEDWKKTETNYNIVADIRDRIYVG